MRVMMVTTNHRTAKELSEQIPGAVLATFETMREALTKIREDPNCILVGQQNLMTMGFTVPQDTLIMVGPYIDGPELVQIRGRARKLGNY